MLDLTKPLFPQENSYKKHPLNHHHVFGNEMLPQGDNLQSILAAEGGPIESITSIPSISAGWRDTSIGFPQNRFGFDMKTEKMR